MRLILALFLCIPAFADDRADAEAHGKRVAQQLRDDLSQGRLTHLAKLTDSALEAVVGRAIAELRRQGVWEYADVKETEWRGQYRGFLVAHTMMHPSQRDIGDHAPLVKWLADFYNSVEAMIGVDACKALHLSDIKTFNFCIPVVFRPCSFPMDGVLIPRKDEYQNHFAEGDVYYGLVPVVTWWAIEIGCMAGTSGIAAFLCGPAAMAGEYAMGKWLAPKLSDLVFSRSCE